MVQRRIYTSTEKPQVISLLESLGFTVKLPHDERTLPDNSHIKITASAEHEILNPEECTSRGAKTEILYIDYHMAGKNPLNRYETNNFCKTGRKIYETLLEKLDNTRVVFFGKRNSWERGRGFE